MRTVHINFSDTFLNEHPYRPALQEVIGYLALWASHEDSRHGHVEIYEDRDHEVLAVYFESVDAFLRGDKATYVIGGVYHESDGNKDRPYYSTHS